MWEWLSMPAVQAAAAIAIVSAAVYIGLRVALALRPATSKADTNVEELAQNFEEMRLEGDISPEELRTIRAVLGKSVDRRTAE
jgi:hypothetical protein